MGKRLLPLFVLVLVVSLSGCILVPGKGVDVPGSIVVQGTITAYGEPVAGASVEVVETSARTLSDESGQYQVKVPPGTYTIKVSRVGYHDEVQEITITEESTDPVDFVLRDAPYYDTDFSEEETGPLTDIPGEREILLLDPQSQPMVVESPARNGKSVKLTGDTGSYGDGFQYILPEPLYDQVTVELWIMPTDTSRGFAISVSDSAIALDKSAVSLYLHNNGNISAYYDGKFHNTGATYEANEWLYLKVVVDIPAKEYDIYVNNTSEAVAQAKFRVDKAEITNVGFLMYSVDKQPPEVYIDSIKIRRRNVED